MSPFAPRLPGLVAVLCLSAAAPAAAQTSISLIAISEEGLWGPDLDRIETAFRKKVEGLGGFEVQPRADTVAHFEEARTLGIDCQARDVECATKIGVIAGADKVLLLRAAPRDGAFYLTLLLVDVSNAGDATRVTQWAPTAGAEHDTAIEEAAVRLFAPEKHLGSLRLLVNPQGAAVTLDGAPAPARDGRGVVGGITPGDHTVVVSAAGFRPLTRSVQVRYKETSEVRVDLQPDDGDAAATVAAVDPGDEGAAPSTDKTPSEVAPDEESPAAPLAISPFVLGGGIAAGAGVLGVLGGVGIALWGDSQAGNLDSTLDERRIGRTLGLVGLTSAVLAGVVVVTGGAAIAWGLVESPRAE